MSVISPAHARAWGFNVTPWMERTVDQTTGLSFGAGPMSYDVRVGRIARVGAVGDATGVMIGQFTYYPLAETKGSYYLERDVYYVVESLEEIEMPKGLCGVVLPKSRLLSSGVQVVGGFIDPGWKGKLVVGFKSLLAFSLVVPVGTPIAQIVIFLADPRSDALYTSGARSLEDREQESLKRRDRSGSKRS